MVADALGPGEGYEETVNKLALRDLISWDMEITRLKCIVEQKAAIRDDFTNSKTALEEMATHLANKFIELEDKRNWESNKLAEEHAALDQRLQALTIREKQLQEEHNNAKAAIEEQQTALECKITEATDASTAQQRALEAEVKKARDKAINLQNSDLSDPRTILLLALSEVYEDMTQKSKNQKTDHKPLQTPTEPLTPTYSPTSPAPSPAPTSPAPIELSEEDKKAEDTLQLEEKAKARRTKRRKLPKPKAPRLHSG